MNIQPKGENLRKAVKWIAAKRTNNPSIDLTKTIEQAGLQFNLSPKDTEFLLKTIKD